MKRGTFVSITCGDRTLDGMVALASPNGKSLVLMFDGMLGGHVGMMPVSQEDDGGYTALMTGEPVMLREKPQCL